MVAPFPALPVAPGSASASETFTNEPSASKAGRAAQPSQIGPHDDAQRDRFQERYAAIANEAKTDDIDQSPAEFVNLSEEIRLRSMPVGTVLGDNGVSADPGVTAKSEVVPPQSIDLFAAVQANGQVKSGDGVSAIQTGLQPPSGSFARDTALENTERPVSLEGSGEEAGDSASNAERSLISEKRSLLTQSLISPSKFAGDHSQPATIAEFTSGQSSAIGQTASGNFEMAGARQVHTGEALPPVAAAQIIETVRNQISAMLSGAGSQTRLEVRLDPPELGRVLIEFRGQGGELVRAVIAAEAPETLDLLRRNADILERALEKGGLKNIDLDFGGEYTDPHTKQQRDKEKSLIAPITLLPPQPDGPVLSALIEASGRLDRRL